MLGSTTVKEISLLRRRQDLLERRHTGHYSEHEDFISDLNQHEDSAGRFQSLLVKDIGCNHYLTEEVFLECQVCYGDR